MKFLPIAILLLAAASLRAETFHASDAVTNYDLATASTWLDGTGGEGWSGPWQAVGGTGGNAEATFAEGSMSLETATGTGETIVGRTFAAPLGEGTLTVRAWHDLGADFVGFAAYGTGGAELVRWGVGAATADTPYPPQGFVCSLDGGASYSLLFDESPIGFVDYTMTWNFLSAQPSFTLEAVDGNGIPYFDAGISVDADSLAAVALIATGDKRIAFDDLSATGTPAVPEPATLALLLAGAAALLPRGGKAKRME